MLQYNLNLDQVLLPTELKLQKNYQILQCKVVIFARDSDNFCTSPHDQVIQMCPDMTQSYNCVTVTTKNITGTRESAMSDVFTMRVYMTPQ